MTSRNRKNIFYLFKVIIYVTSDETVQYENNLLCCFINFDYRHILWNSILNIFIQNVLIQVQIVHLHAMYVSICCLFVLGFTA